MNEDIAAVVRRAAAAAPAGTWDVADVMRRGRRRRWLTAPARHRRSALVAGAVAAVAAGAATLAPATPTPTPPPRPPGLVLWAGAADPDHLYALRADCPQRPCTVRLFGSDDAGATWTERTDRISLWRTLTMVPGGGLYSRGYRPAPAMLDTEDLPPFSGVGDSEAVSAVSADGGRTWLPVATGGPEWASVPEGIPLICIMEQPPQCRLGAADPATGRQAVLAHEPGAYPGGLSRSGRIIVRGSRVGGTGPSLSISADGGASWTTHPAPYQNGCGDPIATPTGPIYLVGGHAGRTNAFACRSADEGATWQKLPLVNGPRGDEEFRLHPIVTADGTLVVLGVPDRRVTRPFQPSGPIRAWVAAPGATSLAPAVLVGVPDQLATLAGDGRSGFVLATGVNDTVYRSTDGLHWNALTVR